MDVELRFLPQDVSHVSIEKREDGREYITGRAIVFNQWSQLLYGWFKEKISPRALEGCDMSDVLNKYNHDLNFLLGRTPDTLTLEVREDGLYYFTPYDPEDPDHVKVRRKIEKKLVRGSSFEFTIGDEGSVWTTEIGSDYELREVVKIAKLYDVAPVVNPAYLQTSAGMDKRSLDSIKEERNQYVERLKAEQRSGETQETPPPQPTENEQQIAEDWQIEAEIREREMAM